MESFPNDILLFLTFALTFILEVWRYSILRNLGLNIFWPAGWRFAYYLSYLSICAGLGSGLTTALMFLVNRAWIGIQALKQPLYLGAPFVVVLVGVPTALIYAAAIRAERAAGGSRSTRRIVFLLLGVVSVELIVFLFKPLRWIYGGSLLWLVSSAFGETIPFTGWNELVDWLKRRQQGQASQAEGIGVQFFIEAEGVFIPRGNGVELRGDEIAGSLGTRVQSLARRLLDRSRLTEIVPALDHLRQRNDLLTVIPDWVAENLERWGALKQQLEHDRGVKAEQKKEKLDSAIRSSLEAQFKDQLQSLLYWHYDMPDDEVRLFVSRAPQPTLVPLITFRQYLGLFLSWWMRGIS
jgi:hypothetical protein